MLDAASSADMAAAAGSSSSIPPLATDPAAVTVAAASSEANTRPPSSVGINVLLELYRMSANADGVVRRQNAWLERVKSKGGVGTLHLTGKKKNRDWRDDGDDEDGEEEYNNAEERGGSEEEEEPLFGRGGVVGELPPSDDEFEYNYKDGPKLDKFGNTVVEGDNEDEGETLSLTEDPNINYRDVNDDGMDVEDDGVRHCKSDPWRTDFSMGSIPNITSNMTVKRNSYIYSICTTLFIGAIPRFCIPHCPNLQSICVCRRSSMCIPKMGD